MMTLSARSLLKRPRKFELAIPMPDLEEYMTTKEAAEKLGFSIQAVNRMVVSNRLEGIRVGRMNLISRKSVILYLEKTSGMSKNDPRRKTSE